MIVGAHAKTGSRGFASHTVSPGVVITFNGMSITETELIGYEWSEFGVPVILVTGDDRLKDDLKTSFFPSLKAELIHGAAFATDEGLRAAVRRYVAYYNQRRLRSALRGSARRWTLRPSRRNVVSTAA